VIVIVFGAVEQLPLLANTEIVPFVPALIFTVKFVVPCPAVMVTPAGTDHVYEVAPLTAAIEYTTPV
jgi:hypothetical protein